MNHSLFYLKNKEKEYYHDYMESFRLDGIDSLHKKEVDD